MKAVKKITAMLLALCMLLPLTACGDTTWAYSIDGEKIPAGVYLYYQMEAYAKAKSHKDIKSNIKDLMKQTLDGKPASQWIQNQTKQSCLRYIATEREYTTEKLTFEDTLSDYVQKSVDEVWKNYQEFYEKNGVGETSLIKVETNNYKRRQAFQKYYSTQGPSPVSDAELQSYFTKNYAGINAFAVQLEQAASGKSLTPAQVEKNSVLEKKVSEYVTDLKSGKSFSSVKNLYTIYSGGQSSASNDDNSTKIYITQDTTQLPSEVAKEIFEIPSTGGVSAIKYNNYYFVTVRYNIDGDANAFSQNRSDVLEKMKGDEFDKILDDMAAKYKVVANDAAIRKYKPSNVDLDTSSAGATQAQ